MQFLQIILCLLQIETHDSFQIGDSGLAVGHLQIHPVMVHEVNRILTLNNSNIRFTLKDREVKTRSIQMCLIFLRHQYKRYYQATGSYPSNERLACSWNTGSIFKLNKSYVGKYNEIQRLRIHKRRSLYDSEASHGFYY